jgi:integrase
MSIITNTLGFARQSLGGTLLPDKGKIMELLATEIIAYNPQENRQNTTQTEIIIPAAVDTRWLQYFNQHQALEAVFAHIAALPSSKNKEQHTLRVYKSGLGYFLQWASQAMPTPDLLRKFIAHLRLDRDAKSTTISSRYLAPVRLYVRSLAGQHIASRINGEPLTHEDRFFIQDAKEQFREAAAMKTPKGDESSNLPPLWQHGNRLTLAQVNQLYATCDINTLAGRRDLAMLYIGFTSALRIAELQRLKLSNIKAGKDGWEIHVRGKRNNIDPVPLDNTAYKLILDWVSAYNDALPVGDPRFITTETSIWQSLQHNDTAFPIGYQGISNSEGISAQALRANLRKHCEQVRKYDFTFPILAPHDMRRSAAALGHSAGMDYPQLQRLLRHKQLSTTFGYVGKAPDLSKSKLSNYVNFTLPTAI